MKKTPLHPPSRSHNQSNDTTSGTSLSLPVLFHRISPKTPQNTHTQPPLNPHNIKKPPNPERNKKHTSKLLRLAPSIIRHQQRAIILHERLLQLVFRVLVHVFLVVGHDGFGDGLADGVDLGGVPAAGDAHADVDGGEFVEAED